MYLKKVPNSIANYLQDIGIIFHCLYRVEKIAIENQFIKAKIFNSHIFSDYKMNHYRYRITIDEQVGEIIIDELNGQLSLLKNNLITDL